jgi:precorrin-2 dehydrogenase/sirohydrochlorin ferrochelatase
MEKKSYGSYFPILIDLSKFKSLVIGGGKIATRKVYNLLDFNTLVTVIAPDITDDLIQLKENGNIIWEERKYKAGDIKDFDLVFCATGDTAVDNLVFEECKEQGVLLNVADVPALCNFIMPSTIKRGDLTISVVS